jgi:hypothetical protein
MQLAGAIPFVSQCVTGSLAASRLFLADLWTWGCTAYELPTYVHTIPSIKEVD